MHSTSERSGTIGRPLDRIRRLKGEPVTWVQAVGIHKSQGLTLILDSVLKSKKSGPAGYKSFRFLRVSSISRMR